MQKIFWTGSPYFAEDLSDCGWEEVCIHSPEGKKFYSWQDIKQIAGFEPDVVVVAADGSQQAVLGMEDFPCLTVFYSAKSHIHSWHFQYAQAFDACLVSLRNNLEKFASEYLGPEKIWWSPAFARNDDQPSPGIAKTADCIFVGTNDPRILPRRASFLRELSGLIPRMQILNGDYRELFPSGRVLLNQSEHGDLNFRVFEAMGCGGCLVTPRIGNGLDKLFVDGEHMVAYCPHDAGDAAYRIRFLLEHPDICEHIAAEAFEKINAAHRSIHRAQSFTDHMCDLAMTDPGEIVNTRRKNASAIRKKYLAPLYELWMRDLPEGQKSAFEAASRGSYGLFGIDA